MGKSKRVFSTLGKILILPLVIIYKTIFYLFLLPLYKLKRTFKKDTLKRLLKQPQFFSFNYYLPLAIIVLISLGGIINNLYAKEVRPEDYGQKNLLYKITTTGELFHEEGQLLEEIEEGPLPEITSPTSYLEGEALTQEEPIEDTEEGIDTLVTTTSDEATLISPEITDPEVVVKNRDKIVDYVVQPGDALSTIAQKFGITTNTLLWENNLSYYSLIRPGQTLKVLPVDGLSYKIQKGDTLQKIAKEYDGEVNKIVEFNKLASVNDIQVGQTIIIPGGEKTITYTPTITTTIKEIFSPAPISQTKLQWPTNSHRITQYFKWRHSAIDIGNKVGQPVYAAESGQVKEAGWSYGGYGYYIIVDHGGGLKTLYAHLYKIHVKVGQNVTRGQVIGDVGNTGWSTGPHLHFEVRVNDIKVNPLDYTR